MTAVTEGSRKHITTVPGVEVVYISTVANGYTFTSKFGKVEAVFFQPIDSTPATGNLPYVTTSVSGSTVTFTVSGAVSSGYLQVWGE